MASEEAVESEHNFLDYIRALATKFQLLVSFYTEWKTLAYSRPLAHLREQDWEALIKFIFHELKTHQKTET